ncbi:MAG: diacylglycerol kinase family protein [Bacteroidia bacterium]
MAKNPLKSSFKYAFHGIRLALKERNFKIHVICSILVVSLGFYFQVSKNEWLILIFCISMVFSLEIVNTSIEKLTDLVSPETNTLAGYAKDLAAAAVLIASIAALIIGSMIFWPYFFN